MLKSLLKVWGRLNSKHLTDGWKKQQIVFNEFCGDSSDVKSETTHDIKECHF
jgi:hypothetical protein